MDDSRDSRTYEPLGERSGGLAVVVVRVDGVGWQGGQEGATAWCRVACLPIAVAEKLRLQGVVMMCHARLTANRGSTATTESDNVLKISTYSGVLFLCF